MDNQPVFPGSQYNNNQPLAYEEEKFNILRQYLPYWPLFLVFTLIMLVGAKIYVRYQLPTFQVNAKIMVKDAQSGDDESKMLGEMNLFKSQRSLDNEIEIIRSWPLVERVVKDLHLYTTQYFPGQVNDLESYGQAAPLLIVADQPESIQSTGKIPVEIHWKENFFQFPDTRIAFGSDVKIAGSRYRISVNPAFSHGPNDVTTILVQATPVAAVGGRIQGGLAIGQSSKQSSMLNISLQTSHPDRGRETVARLLELYEKGSLDDKNMMATNTLNFVEDRLKLVGSELDSVESNIEQYKRSEGIVDISAQGSQYLASLTQTDKSLGEIDIQLQVLKDIENYINDKGPNPGTVPSLMGVSEPTLVNLLNRLYELEIQYKKLASVTGEQNDQLLQIKEQIVQLKPSLRENIRNIRSNLMVTRGKLNADLGRANALVKTIPAKEKNLIEISRQQTIKNNIYSFLLQRREEAALSFASAVADSRVIESPRASGGFVKPTPSTVYVLAVFAGIGLALIIVAFREQLNNKVLFGRDLKKATRIPLIGEIAYIKHKEEFVIRDGKRTIVAEQIRAIRGNLPYFGLDDREKNVLLVTSSISGEGKSFISINLGISLTLTGKKVVILELDLRRPKISKAFGIARDKGVSSYLVGRVAIEEIIKTTQFPNLFVVPSGAIPPNPSELLMMPTFAELIAELKTHFDYIIMDSPPIGLVSDAQILGKFSDANIFVVRHNYTPKSYLELLRSLYEGNKYSNMSIVFNAVKPRGMGRYGYRYGYGYGYGYGNGYGYGYSKDYYLEEEKDSKPDTAPEQVVATQETEQVVVLPKRESPVKPVVQPPVNPGNKKTDDPFSGGRDTGWYR